MLPTEIWLGSSILSFQIPSMLSQENPSIKMPVTEYDIYLQQMDYSVQYT